MNDFAGFRDPTLARYLLADIARVCTRRWAIMEVCGGQTHALVRHGLDRLLEDRVELIHGPGCPVCVTPVQTLDRALALAARPDVIFCTFGDMLRVPGSASDLQRVRAAGGDVRVLYSPLESLALARQNPGRQVVFFGVGFETTAPAYALAVYAAAAESLANFSILTSLVRVPPALAALLGEPGNRVQAVLAAGHVCGVMGYHEYPPLCAAFGVPVVVTGFEPLDLLEGVRRAVIQLEAGQAVAENAYERAVTFEGNAAAQAMLRRVFEPTDREWRGIGVIPASGWRVRPEYRRFDAESRFPDATSAVEAAPNPCRSGDVLRGRLKPPECPAFGRECTPRTPLGATMVSAEGACAAYFHAGRVLELGVRSPQAARARPATV